jgi:maltose alpha-D-glucosyltransferase/alpha-amylase
MNKRTNMRPSLLRDDPFWYKDTIIYELHIRGFSDSQGDGVGDFLGLTEKLDYLEDLGVTSVWLLPFYPSPLKDDGYDISGYTSIQPVYGNMHDFRTFVDEAHQRGLHVIIELTPRKNTERPASSSRTPNTPTGHGTTKPGHTTGTASIHTSLI